MIPILRPGEPLPPDADFGYVVAARGGHFLRRRGPFYVACVRIDEVPHLPEEREYFRFTGPKIPASLFAQILTFFEAVHDEHNSEAAVLLTFMEGKWGVVVPPQETTGVSVKYSVPAGVRPAGSVHSHPGMSARFSSTDVADERCFDGVHLVVADRGFIRPAVACAAVIAGRRIDLDVEDLVERYAEDIEIPANWLSMVKGTAHPLKGGDDPAVPHKAHEPEPVCEFCASNGGCPYHQPDPDWLCPLLFDEREEGPCTAP